MTTIQVPRDVLQAALDLAESSYIIPNSIIDLKQRRKTIGQLILLLDAQKVGRKTMSKAFCNPARFDDEDLAYNHDYLNE